MAWVLLWAMGCGPTQPVDPPDPKDPKQGTDVEVQPNPGDNKPDDTEVWPSPTPPSDLPSDPDQADAVEYAWQQFLALSWPAMPGQRGVPNTGVAFGTPGTTVWESWKADYEIFLSDGSTPTSWNEYGPIPPECTGVGALADARVITRVSKAPDAIERVDQAVGGTLTDQHGNLARYELRMNETEFDFVVSGTLYNTQGQDKLTGPVDMTDGSMEMKAAWRLMTPADSGVLSRFYTIDAWVYTPPIGGNPATCVQQTLGLVGLHLTQKTPNHKQWLWATFEQVDNVPEDPNNPGTGPYSFFDPTCSPADCPWNKSTQNAQGEPTGKPTQVTRVIGLDSETTTANATYQGKLASQYPTAPWQYYELVGVQWPRLPDTGGTGYPIPGNNGNTTMETYLGADSSCIDCHFKASTASTTNPQTADFSFMLQEAKPATGAVQ